MNFIAAAFLHEAREIGEKFKVEGIWNQKPGLPPAYKYLYAPYLLNGFRKPKVYLAHGWERNKTPEELQAFADAFCSRQVQIIYLNSDLEIQE